MVSCSRLRSSLPFALALFLGLAALAPGAWANAQPFGEWLQGVRAEALRRGMKPATVERALVGVQPIPRVIELDRKQPEFTMTMREYIAKVVNQTRVDLGRQALADNRAVLVPIGQKYGVQPRFIVALWGIETNYGSTTGNFSVIAALVTLAYDGRRSKYFREELMDALKILDQGHIAPGEMRGSWAGAMGQNQFMPSSFLRFAVDEDGDGRKNIWTSRTDIFASIANYLKGVGWRDDQTWGRPVRLPASFDESLADGKTKRAIDAWAALGIRSADGAALPQRAGLVAGIVSPEGRDGPSFMVYDNFNHIMRWNRSTYFATAVGLLADRLAR